MVDYGSRSLCRNRIVHIQMNTLVRTLFEQHTMPNFGCDTDHTKNERGEYNSPALEDHWNTYQECVEAVIRECVEQIKLQGTDWLDWKPSEQAIRPEYVALAEHIKKHFGVK